MLAKVGKTGQGDSEEAMSAAVAAAARAQKRLQHVEKAQGNGRSNLLLHNVKHENSRPHSMCETV